MDEERLDRLDKKVDLLLLYMQKQMAWNDRYDRDNFTDDVSANVVADLLFEYFLHPETFFDN